MYYIANLLLVIPYNTPVSKEWIKLFHPNEVTYTIISFVITIAHLIYKSVTLICMYKKNIL